MSACAQLCVCISNHSYDNCMVAILQIMSIRFAFAQKFDKSKLSEKRDKIYTQHKRNTSIVTGQL